MPSHINGVPVHPAAELFPLLQGKAFDELKADIAEHGLLTPVTYLDGEIIDGRNRYRACIELGIEPDEDEIDTEVVPDPYAWVISTNLHRRHLSETQRETIAGKIANLKQGGDRKSESIKGQNCPSIDEAAAQLNVKPRSVKNAKAAIKGGCDALIEAMERDEITSSLAAKFVKAVPSKRKQKAIVKDGVNAVRQAVKDWKFEQKELSKPKPSEAELYEDVDEEEVEDDDEPAPTQRMQSLKAFVAELKEYELIIVRDWIIDRIEAYQ